RLGATAASSDVALMKLQGPPAHPSAVNDPRRTDTTPPCRPSEAPRDDIAISREDLLTDAADALVVDPAESDDGLTDTERYEGYAAIGDAASRTASLDSLLADELRDGAHADPDVAADEGHIRG